MNETFFPQGSVAPFREESGWGEARQAESPCQIG